MVAAQKSVPMTEEQCQTLRQFAGFGELKRLAIHTMACRGTC